MVERLAHIDAERVNWCAKAAVSKESVWWGGLTFVFHSGLVGVIGSRVIDGAVERCGGGSCSMVGVCTVVHPRTNV